MLPCLPEAASPFVLLDDARPGARTARLYRDPLDIVSAYAVGEVAPALERLRAAGRAGHHVAGYLAYDAGFALEPALAPLAAAIRPGPAPLLWFGIFDAPAVFPAANVPSLLPMPEHSAGPVIAADCERAHGEALARVLAYIRDGDIYQANFTIRATVAIAPDPLAAYAAIRPHAAMGYGAIVRHDGRHILSFSPERFFVIDGRDIDTLPMKGTAPRHADADADRAAIAAMRTDPKQRAENLMIVDLLRNDLARICAPGSVRVPSLFAVETYPTVHQMVSRVTGRLADGMDAVDAIRALFPCGSITGAPKIRAMQIIAELEDTPRGIYSGAIGSIDPEGSARFNVAIRTISVEKDAGNGVIGLGSAIIADSDAAAEWRECMDKAGFLSAAAARGESGA